MRTYSNSARNLSQAPASNAFFSMKGFAFSSMNSLMYSSRDQGLRPIVRMRVSGGRLQCRCAM